MMVYTYIFYIIVSLVVTILVGRSLNKNGRVFLVEIFRGKENIADSVNHLLLVGFYLINLGFILLALRYGSKPEDLVGAVEFLSTKIGLVVVVLGFMHFFNMRFLIRFRDSRIFQAIGPKEDDSLKSRMEKKGMPT